MLGEDRGPVLEVIVSRTNFISSHTHRPVRIIGLSTACANARDLANWLGIKQCGLYNFKPSVRPVPLEVDALLFLYSSISLSVFYLIIYFYILSFKYL